MKYNLTFLKFHDVTESYDLWNSRDKLMSLITTPFNLSPRNVLIPFHLATPAGFTLHSVSVVALSTTRKEFFSISSEMIAFSGYVKFDGYSVELNDYYHKYCYAVKFTNGEDLISFRSEVIAATEGDLLQITASNDKDFANIPFSNISLQVYVKSELSISFPEVYQKGYEDGVKNNVFTFQKLSAKRQFSFVATDNMLEAIALMQILDEVTLVDEWGISYGMNDIEVKTDKINDYTALMTVTFIPYYFTKPII